MKVGLLDYILRGYFLLQKPLMTVKEHRIYKSLLLELSRRQPLDIFEYGTGFSTLYFSKFLRSKGIRFHVHSVEHDKTWHLDIQHRIDRAHLTKDVTLHLSQFTPGLSAPQTPGELDYVDMPRALGMKFDLIVVDGRFRRRCLETAPAYLKAQGIVFLHDAERSFYHGPLKGFLFGRFIDGAKFYPFEPRPHHVWVGSMDNPLVDEIADQWQKGCYRK